MESQYYYKLMASYLSKRNCDESFVRYFLGKSAKKSPEELERADERKRRLQRERSRRYRALKNARRQHGVRDADPDERRRPEQEPDELSDADEPPTLCDLSTLCGSSDCASDDNSAHSAADTRVPAAPDDALSLRELLTSPNTELDYPTVHSLMFHWLQT